MKYIITESRLEETIINYLEKEYGDVYMEYGNDDDGEETDCLATFWGDDEKAIASTREIFWYIKKCWWLNNGDSSRINIDDYPMLTMEERDLGRLNGFFGTMWHTPFKKWFKQKFDLDIVTIK